MEAEGSGQDRGEPPGSKNAQKVTELCVILFMSIFVPFHPMMTTMDDDEDVRRRRRRRGRLFIQMRGRIAIAEIYLVTGKESNGG